MNRFSGGVILIVLCICWAVNSGHAQTQETDVVKTEISGSWTCHRMYVPMKMATGARINPNEEVLQSSIVAVARNWVVTGDTIYEFIYPCKYLGCVSYTMVQDSLLVNGNPRPFYSVTRQHGGIQLTYLWGIDKGHILYFERDSFELGTIKNLILDTIDLSCISGRYKFQVPIYGGKSDNKGDSTLIHVPDIISVDEHAATRIIYDSLVFIPIDGINREFKVREIAWDQYDGDYVMAVNDGFRHKIKLTLVPGPWWNQEPFDVVFIEE